RGHEMSRATTGEYNLYRPNGASIQFTYARGGRGKSYFTPTRWWIESYEPQDDRAQNYIMRKYFTLKSEDDNAPGNGADILPSDGSKNYGDTIMLNWSEANQPRADHSDVPNWPYSRKGEGTDPADMAADFAWSDQIYLRLADTYLLKAEAQFKLGDPAAAAATINIIRQRSNATDITAGDVDIDFIPDERSRELIVEEERRYTLLRTGKWSERTQKYNHYGGEMISLRDTLFPVPQAVIDANLTLDMPQNPGW
ncbi:MAG: RagB/SusD family nutrient uptake outer membrane protein, partial [Bacteroidales bacterium]|nr:RagB/SusD family nutrient uptake outer membrane protein [Bacteroidales bacterium]